MAYAFKLNEDELYRALQAVKTVGGLAVVHAEWWDVIQSLIAENLAAGRTSPHWHPRSRPASLEGDAVALVTRYTEEIGVPVHIFHLGCVASVNEVARARARGLPVTGETCPQYLALNRDVYDRPGVLGAQPICAPPLRSEADRVAMWQALASDQLQIVATDHCPFVNADKMRGIDASDFTKIPGGVPSIEVRCPMIYSMGVHGGVFTENRWVDVCCTTPAKLAGFTHKGVIAPGFDADLVIFDPDHTWTVSTETLHENCDWTPYEGIELTGKVHTTLSRGRVIVDNGAFTGGAGDGRYVVRSFD
jgi:dihydropyrimidinase